jgi:hypothetical protein
MAFGLFGTIIVYLIPVFAGIINLKYKNQMLRHGILIYCAVITALAWQVGADFTRYLEIINNATVLKLTLVEPLTETIYFLTNKIGEPRVFWIMLALITYGSLFFLIRGLTENEKDGTIILFFFLFGIIGIALRQMSSVVVSLLAIQSYYNKQYKKAGFFLLFAWSIHKTAIMVPLIPIVGFLLSKLNKYTLALVPTSMLILITIFSDIILFVLDPIPLLGKYWYALMTYQEGIYLSPVGITISIVFGVVYLLSSDCMHKNLSANNYECYLSGIFGFSLIFGFSSIHAGRLMIAFGAAGLPAFTHFFKTHEVPIATGLPAFTRFIETISFSGIFAVLFSVLFITVIFFDYDYLPYNISKDINWISEDDLGFKLGYYELSEIQDFESRFPSIEIDEDMLIPAFIVILIVFAAGFAILHIWKRMINQILISGHSSNY